MASWDDDLYIRACVKIARRVNALASDAEGTCAPGGPKRPGPGAFANGLSYVTQKKKAPKPRAFADRQLRGARPFSLLRKKRFASDTGSRPDYSLASVSYIEHLRKSESKIIKALNDQKSP